MDVNTQEANVIGKAVNNAAFAGLAMSQAGELTVGVVERISANVECHPHDVDAQIPIKIEMTRNDSEEAGEQSHACRCHFEPLEKLSQPESYWPIKIEIEHSLDLGCLVSGLESGR